MLATSVLHNTNITYDLAFFGKGVVRLTKRVVRLMKRVVRLTERVVRLVKGVVRVAAPHYYWEIRVWYILKPRALTQGPTVQDGNSPDT